MSEENSLDDFFASKDKSKKKSTKSSFTPDDIEHLMEKKLNKNKKSSKAKRKECDEETSQSLKVKTAEDDAEWKEYEEVVKDYSGLKIQSLAPGTKNGVDQDSTGNQSGDEELGEKKEALQGPWKPVAAPVSIPDPELEPDAVMLEVPKSGKYVPPAARQINQSHAAHSTTSDKPSGKYVPPAMRQMHTSGISSKLGVRNKKVAPDVSNVEDFPSLSAATIIEQGKLNQDFEKVKGGAKQVANPLNNANKISLNNKFGALEDGDS